MKKLLSIFIVFVFWFVLAGVNGQVFAQCPAVLSDSSASFPPYEEGMEHTIVLDFAGITHDEYFIIIKDRDVTFIDDYEDTLQSRYFTIPSNSSGNTRNISHVVDEYIVTLTITGSSAFTAGTNQDLDTDFIQLYKVGDVSPTCTVGQYTIVPQVILTGRCAITVRQDRVGSPDVCFAPGCLAQDMPVTITATGLEMNNEPYNGLAAFTLGSDDVFDFVKDGFIIEVSNGTLSDTFTPETNSWHSVSVKQTFSQLVRIGAQFPGCSTRFDISRSCAEDDCSSEEDLIELDIERGSEEFSLCKQIPASQTKQIDECLKCTEGTEDEEGNEGIWTAIGCIKRDPQSIMQRFISVGLGMVGGVALLTFLAAGFIFSTSQGDPKAYGKAKEMMTASIVGIIFVIFSVTMLQFIGFEILKIPGFGG